jgi:hypothetical protein
MELYWCVNCWQCGHLGPSGRCGNCNSDSVVSTEAQHYASEYGWSYYYQVRLTGSVFEPLYR